MTRKDKPINTIDELEEFTVSVIYSLGNAISNVEAERAIMKAFHEFKSKVTILVEPRTAAGSLD